MVLSTFLCEKTCSGEGGVKRKRQRVGGGVQDHVDDMKFSQVIEDSWTTAAPSVKLNQGPSLLSLGQA